jgi:hypothetical protein
MGGIGVTILAGVVSRIAGAPISDATRHSLRQLISRHDVDEIEEFGDASSFLAKVDIGAFGAPAAHRDNAGNASLLAGEPLLNDCGDEVASRLTDLQRLHAEWLQSNWNGLTKCRGTFCAIHYNPREHVLSLIADKIGLRPIYYWVGPRFVIFATALRILEGLAEVPQEMDLRGATEIACFGYPLGERTGYAGISTIRAGQVVQIYEKTVVKTDYWRWDRLSPVRDNISQVSRETYHRFMSAVARRIGRERSAVAFLSGGLDSRSIVAALHTLGVELHTLNFAPEGTQDRVLAAGFARILGTRHHELMPGGDREQVYMGGAYNQPRVSRWFESEAGVTRTPRRRLVWSGDGGSVGLGHVYLNAKMIELAQAGKMDSAIAAFRRHNGWGIAPGILQSTIAGAISRIPGEGIREELARLECADRGRVLHLFLMLNDQRRHLAKFFENIDIDRLEFHLPFYDSHFLEPILASPVGDFLGHRFYMEWLKNFPPSVVSVPWQAYPNHVPCPLPIPKGLRYQWTDYDTPRLLRQLRRGLLQEIDTSLATRYFPAKIINRGKLRLVTWLTRMGIRDYGYLLKVAAVYCRYSTKRGVHILNGVSQQHDLPRFLDQS